MVEKRDGPTDDGVAGVETDAYRATFDWSDGDQPSATLVEVLARLQGIDPLDVEPLHDHLDPDALDALFAREAPGGEVGAVTLSVDGSRIRIEREGRIVAWRAEDGPPRRP